MRRKRTTPTTVEEDCKLPLTKRLVNRRLDELSSEATTSGSPRTRSRSAASSTPDFQSSSSGQKTPGSSVAVSGREGYSSEEELVNTPRRTRSLRSVKNSATSAGSISKKTPCASSPTASPISLRSSKVVPKLVFRRSALRRAEQRRTDDDIDVGPEEVVARTPIPKLRLRRSQIGSRKSASRAPRLRLNLESDDEADDEGVLDLQENQLDSDMLSIIRDENVVPLKGREREFIQICDGIQRGIEEHVPSTFYLSGLPGTGKTATMRLVLQALTKCTRSVTINCASVKTQKELLSAVMNGQKSGRSLSMDSLSKYAHSLAQPLIIVLDEVDHLKSNSILYSVFRWPQDISWKVVVIGIANSIDLTERLLPKLKLTVPPVLLPFAPYEKNEITQILADKMKTDQSDMDARAIELCARKVAAVSGDLRSAIRIMKQANSTSSAAGTPTGTREVLGVLNSVYSSPLARAKLPLQPRLLLAVCLRMSSNKKTALTRNALFNSYGRACEAVKIPPLSCDDLETAWGNLEAQSFVSMDKSGRIRLQVDAATARSVIADSHMIASIDKLNL